MNIRDATDEALDDMVKKSVQAMRSDVGKRLREIAAEVAQVPITPAPLPLRPNPSKAMEFQILRRKYGV